MKNTTLPYKFRILLLSLFVSTIACDKNSGGGTQPPIPPVVVPTNMFSNPLLSGGPDPWVIRKDNFYYYTHTLGNRIAIWKTAQISDLKGAPVTNIWSPPPGAGPTSDNIWAPEIHFINNKWYAYFAADNGINANHRMYVLENSSSDPLSGTWDFKGKITDPSDKWAIDGTVLEITGQLYFIWSGWEGNFDGRQDLYIAKMQNPWTIEGNRVMISTPTYDWEKLGIPDIDVNEGPEILKSPTGKIFLTYSASGCWNDDYSLGMLTLKDGSDPLVASNWTKTPTPVFTKNPSGSAYGPGHNAFFKSPDGTEDWLLYHANTSPGKGCSDERNPRIQKFTWNADGTPNFGQPAPLNTKLKRPSGEKD